MPQGTVTGSSQTLGATGLRCHILEKGREKVIKVSKKSINNVFSVSKVTFWHPFANFNNYGAKLHFRHG